MISARHTQKDLHFKFPAGTSRGVLLHKPTSYLILENDGCVGIGECSTIPYLSIDPQDDYVQKLDELCRCINLGNDMYNIDLKAFPSIAFGLETAWLDLSSKGSKQLFPSDFTAGEVGIPINGLVWMGDKNFMKNQIQEKIAAGYRCIKLKVGAIDFNTELNLISDIRKQFSVHDMTIRVDANGAFSSDDALEKIKQLSVYGIHSIEQPIGRGQWEEMAELCEHSPIPIVLDEELIGVPACDRFSLLEKIQPNYILLKPSLIGGFAVAEDWISKADGLGIGWWITSALESNIGLNAIAQWTYTLHSSLPQGLGTGQLYHDNIPSPLEIENAKLFYRDTKEWDLSTIIG
jgi:o-succinylbenzoate synthase